MLRTLLIVICLGLTACGSSPLSPQEMHEAEVLCISHGGVDTITATADFPENLSFDTTCVDGVELHFHKYQGKRS